MITTRTDYSAGQTKLLGLASITDADLEKAEQEVFMCVFAGVTYNEVDGLTNDNPLKALFARILVPFVFCQFCRNRNAYLKLQGQVTETATAYGSTTTSRLLEVWNTGVQLGGAVFEGNKSLFVAEFAGVDFIAKIKL